MSRTTTAVDTRPVTRLDRTVDPPVLHMVLKSDWPIALCGANVSERFTGRSSGLDRCPTCLKVASERGLGRPGWA